MLYRDLNIVHHAFGTLGFQCEISYCYVLRGPRKRNSFHARGSITSGIIISESLANFSLHQRYSGRMVLSNFKNVVKHSV